MTRLCIAAVVCSALIYGPVSSATSENTKTWRVGVAKVEITPSDPIWMGGYKSRNRPAEGKLTDLWAKALVLEDGHANRLILITADLVGVDRKLGLAIRRAIATQQGVPLGSVALNVSHTHSGPVVGDVLAPQHRLTDDQRSKIQAYAEQLQHKIIGVAAAAVSSLAPGQVHWGSGRCTFATNRRENKEAEVPQLRQQGQLKGPVDHTVPVLKVAGADGEVRAIVFGYACHATVTNFYRWSGDYPGFAQIGVEQANPGAIAMFWAGCGADQNPLPRRTEELLVDYGQRLASAVNQVVQAKMQPISGNLAAAYKEVPLAFAKPWTEAEVRAKLSSRQEKEANWARIILERRARGETPPTHYPYPVQVWRLGSGPVFVFLGGEVVVDYSLSVKQDLGQERTWVAGYSNDVMNYIPSRRVLLEGGYEGIGGMFSYARHTSWTVNVEQTIRNTVRNLAEQTP